jgi:uncharacterized membrane protein YbhN (UPF0104 family)
VLFLSSFVEIGLTVTFFWALLSGLDQALPIAYVVFATMGSFMLSRMPVTPGGLGVFEASLAGHWHLLVCPSWTRWPSP